MLKATASCHFRLSARQTSGSPCIRHVGRVLAFSTSSDSLTASRNTAVPVKLRNYQQECIQSVIRSLKKGSKRVGISLATGSGKTVIFTQLIQKINSRPNGADKTLILAHRRELVEQAARHCQTAYPGKSIEVEMGSIHASGTADITIASIQSINSKNRLDKYDPSAFKLVLVDEAHHIVAPGYLRVLKHFGLDQKQEDTPHLVGVSATFSRFDGVKLGAAIDEIVYHKDYVDMISDKWLSDVIFTTVASTANLTRIRSNSFGDFQTGELSRAVNTDKINNLTVQTWMAKAGDRKSTLVFCVDIDHVMGLTDAFRRFGYASNYVTGDTPKADRSDILDSFKRGEFPVLVNCGVFTEGTDIPNIDCIVLARPTRSRNLLVQMIGRGMRLHPGKENCHIIDLVSGLETGIVSTPTLFGLDPDEIVTKQTVSEMRALHEKHLAQKKETPLEVGHLGIRDTDVVTLTDYDSVLDLIADTSGERHIRALSQYAWVQVGIDRFVLGAPSGSYLRIERVAEGEAHSLPTYRAVEVRALPPALSKSPYAAPREILKASSFDAAVHGADTFASKNFPHTFVHRHQPWRSLPPTQGQLDLVKRMGGEGGQLGLHKLTKGKAADMITKLKHGAKGQFARIEAKQRRKQKQASLANDRIDRETVRVGPVMS